MSQPLFSIGDWPVTPQIAAMALAGLVVVMLIAAIVAVLAAMRGANRRLAEAAAGQLESVRAGLREQIADRDERIRTLRAERDEEARAHSDLKARYAGLRAGMEEQARQNAETIERFKAMRQQMTDEFKALAGDVLRTHSETFSKQNREQVDLLLKPLSEKIVAFQAGLMKDRAELVAQVKTLHTSSLEMAREAGNLTRALKGNSQVQGAWGEMILTSILERSGLKAGEQFRVQQSHAGEDGSRLRTDVEIILPNSDDAIIIDSKVSLTAFESYVNATEEDGRAQSLKAHIGSIRSHIRTLGGKDYHRHAKAGFDFVLMFVPIESAFAAALNADPGLLDFAIEHNVFPTTPTTLMSALRTIHNIWQIENRQKNAEEIAERAGLLYEKVAGFLGTMDRLEGHIDKARQAFDTAKGQLATGSGNVVRQVEMLRELGARTNKRISSGWLDSEAGAETVPERRASAHNSAFDPVAALPLEGRE